MEWIAGWYSVQPLSSAVPMAMDYLHYVITCAMGMIKFCLREYELKKKSYK